MPTLTSFPELSELYQREPLPVLVLDGTVYRVFEDNGELHYGTLPEGFERSSLGTEDDNFRGWLPPVEVLEHEDFRKNANR